MEGALLKKTTGGQWHSRQFTLEGSVLTWLKSDGKTIVSVDVSKNAEVRDVKFGTKKFLFDVIVQKDTISLAASGEAEKAAWMAALTAAMGKKDEAEVLLQKSVGRKSVKAKDLVKMTPGQSPAAIAAAATSPPTIKEQSSSSSTLLPSTAPTAAVVSGGLSSQAANAKLAAKLGGKLGAASVQTLCVVCGLTVYKPEEVVVDKTSMHKRCFQCNHCKRQLSFGNFACINGTFYCKTHYFELFANSGGKYEAFGDAGFKHKAGTSYTPGEVLAPGSVKPITIQKEVTQKSSVPAVEVMATPSATPSVAAAEKVAVVTPKTVQTPSPKHVPTSPLAAAVTSAATKKVDSTVSSSIPSVQSVPIPVESPKAIPPTPKKLEIKAPVSNVQKIEKKEVEVLPKKDMEGLRKMIVLPGMGGPPKTPKKAPEPVATEQQGEENKVVNELKSERPQSLSRPASFRLPPTPAGINFAMEAVKARQAQLGKTAAPEEDLIVPDEGRASVRLSKGGLDHSAVLSKPRVQGRRAPKIEQVGKLLPKAEIDRMTHENTFRVEVQGETLIVYATSQFERDHWVHTLNANIYALGLKWELQQAQKRDMMSALTAQINLENFTNDNQMTYSGFLEKVSMKSQRNWKKRWFVLTEKGELMYYENENSKKPKHTIQLTHLSLVKSADGTRLDAPLVINTGVDALPNESGAAGQLPSNIAIFDNQDVTVDLNILVPEELRVQPSDETNVEDFVVVEKESEEKGESVNEIKLEEGESTPESNPTSEVKVEERPVIQNDSPLKVEDVSTSKEVEEIIPEKENTEDVNEKPNNENNQESSEVKIEDEVKAPRDVAESVVKDNPTIEIPDEIQNDQNSIVYESPKMNDAWAIPGKAPDRPQSSNPEKNPEKQANLVSEDPTALQDVPAHHTNKRKSASSKRASGSKQQGCSLM